MNFKELSELRYSVRNYTQEALTKEEINYILECARLAPSAVNFQPWHFYVAETEETKEKVRSCYQREWFKEAPTYIVCTICHDEAWVRKSDNKEHGNIDIAIAVEHICLAAADLGLGTCWVCNFDAELCHKLLNLPENEEAAVLIPVGHIAEGSERKPKQRKDFNEIVSFI